MPARDADVLRLVQKVHIAKDKDAKAEAELELEAELKMRR